MPVDSEGAVDFESMTTLGVDAIRKRPRMYLKDLYDDPRLGSHLVQEGACLSLAMAEHGLCSRITVDVLDPLSVEIADDGPGLSTELDSFGLAPITHLLTDVAGCRNAKPDDRTRRYCDLGIVMLNALSSHALAEVRRDGATWRQAFQHGRPSSKFNRTGPASTTGIRLRFRLDESLMPGIHIQPETLESWVCRLREQLSCVLELRDFRRRVAG